MNPSYTFREIDHTQLPPSPASFNFDTSKFGGEHAPATAKKIAAAKAALREATRLYNLAIGAIEGKPVKSVKSGVVVVVCNRRVKFLRTEEQKVRQVIGHDGPDQSRVLEGTASVVVEQFELAPGVPTLVPAWVTSSPHFAGLQKDGHLSAL